MANIITVTLREQSISPKKARLVIDMVRGMRVDKAISQTAFINKKASRLVNALLKSALDGAKKKDFKEDELFVTESICQEGRRLKRFQVKARGRSSQFRKRASHLKISLGKIEEVPTKNDKKIKKVAPREKKEKNGSKS